MFYVNVMIFCKGNIKVYINFDTIYLATYFFHVCVLDTFFSLVSLFISMFLKNYQSIV